MSSGTGDISFGNQQPSTDVGCQISRYALPEEMTLRAKVPGRCVPTGCSGPQLSARSARIWSPMRHDLSSSANQITIGSRLIIAPLAFFCQSHDMWQPTTDRHRGSECAWRGELASAAGPARPSRVLVIGSSPLGGRFGGFDDCAVTIDDGRPPCGVCFAVGGIGVIGRVDNRRGRGRRVAVCCSDIAGGTGREGEG
jgi:hypothetical protein